MTTWPALVFSTLSTPTILSTAPPRQSSVNIWLCAAQRVYDSFTLFLYKQCANRQWIFFVLFLFAYIFDYSLSALCLLLFLFAKILGALDQQSAVNTYRCKDKNGNRKIVRASKSKKKWSLKMWTLARNEQFMDTHLTQSNSFSANSFFIVSSTATLRLQLHERNSFGKHRFYSMNDVNYIDKSFQ